MILLDVLASNPKLEGFINSLIEQGSHLGSPYRLHPAIRYNHRPYTV